MADRRALTAAAMRDDLVDALVAAGTIRSHAVEAAMRWVPRERFVPDLDVTAAYEDRAQLVKEGDGATLSTISQPTMVAIMLELADLSPGDRVLEIGTGTGYNAALLGRLVGADGTVVSVDVEADLVTRAAATIADLGLDQVAVQVADGRSGWPAGAPYDVVLATASVGATVPEAWREQTADGGRILVPLRERGVVTVEQRRGDRWEVLAATPASFIPLR